MKKILVTFILVIVFAGYFWFQKQSLLAIDVVPTVSATPSRTPVPTPLPIVDGTTVSTPTSTPKPIPTARPTPTPTPQLSGFKNGTYTTQTSNVYGHGNLQFQVVIQSGKISDIQFLQYPTNGSTSRQISNYSLPTLSQEAITAQSANVDIISGATETSQVFAQLLNSLLSGIKV